MAKPSHRRRILAASLIAAWIAPAAAQPQPAPVEIPVILSLTGGAAFLGNSEWQAMQLALKSFNAAGGIHGRPAAFIVHDDQSLPQLAVQLATEIKASQPPIVIGSTLVALCNAMSPLFRTGPVQYCMSPAIHPMPGGYIFSSSVNFDALVTTAIRFLRDEKITRVAAIFSTDASGQDIKQADDAALAMPENSAMKMVEEVRFNPTDVSVAAQMERVKSAAPQAFLAWAPGAQVATVFKGLVAAGLDLPVVTTSANMTYAQMHQYADFLPRELYIPSAEWPQASTGMHFDPAVEAAHRTMFAAFATIGVKPDEPTVDGWEVATLVLHVLSTLPDNPTAEQMRAAIAHLKGYAGVDGIYDFEKTPQRGLDDSTVVMTRWDPKAQTFVIVSEPGTGKPLN